MLKRISLLAAAFGTMGLLAGQTGAADAPAPDAKPAPAADVKDAKTDAPLALPAGFTVKSDAKDAGVRKELATTANNALTLNHFDNFLANLVDEDRKRMGDIKDKKLTDLDGKINVLRTFWKDKYGKDFDVGADPALAGPFASVVMGEVSDSAQALASWPVDAMTGKGRQAGEAVPAGSREEVDKPFGGAKNLEKGRNIALVRIPASHGLPAVNASMIHEAIDNWRFDIPNNRTGQQIHDDLLAELTAMSEHYKDWPNDINEAYRMATHHVVAAVYGVKAKPAGGDRTTPSPTDPVKPAEKP